jgi:hypothetical protein
MPDLKFLLWNMEWMNDLFVSGEEDDPAEFMPDDAVSSHHRGRPSASAGLTSPGLWTSSLRTWW